ncbi:MAG: phage/plasmid primase, P4 family, partial [Dehalococcoidia bacterium]|nr:phage/plasmid primase, P4 family [Dehalococcoidia bacterium]
DSIRARKLYKNGFEFTPLFKLFLAANHKPIIRETTAAMWERVHLVPFTQTIPAEERDVGLRDKLRAELPGILTWAVEGCRLWQRQGLCPPAIVLSETENYRGEMDVLAGFLLDWCLKGADNKVAAGILYLAYREWCEDNGDRYPMNQTNFGLRLRERNASEGMNLDKRRNKEGRWVWHGIKLLKEPTVVKNKPTEDLFDKD